MAGYQAGLLGVCVGVGGHVDGLVGVRVEGCFGNAVVWSGSVVVQMFDSLLVCLNAILRLQSSI